MNTTLPKYSDWSPTPWDPKGLNCSHRQNWLVAPVLTTRDSGCLARANFDSALECFKFVDPDENDHEEYTFNHWGPGYFDIILVRPNSKCAKEAQDMASALADYPILDENRFSKYEVDAEIENWNNWARSEWRDELLKWCPEYMEDRVEEYTDDRLDALWHGSCAHTGNYPEWISDTECHFPFTDCAKAINWPSFD